MPDFKKFSLTQQQKTIIGLIILALTIIIVLFSGSNGITTQQANDFLTRFEKHITEHAALHQKEASFKHGAITLEGWGNDKKARVENISLELTQKSPIDAEKFSFSTGEIWISKDRLAGGKYYVNFPAPVNVICNSELAYVIDSEDPIKYGVYDRPTATEHSLNLPPLLTIASGPMPASDKKSLVISVARENQVKVEMDSSTGNRHVTYQLPQIAFKAHDVNMFAADSIMGDYTVEKLEEGQVTGKYDFKINNFTTADAPSHPYGAALQGSYKGDRMEVDYVGLRPLFGNGEITLDKVALVGNDFSVTGMGNLVMAKEDPLPSGSLDLDISNASQLITSDLVPSPLRGVLEAALKRASGTSGAFAERTSVPMKRAKNGVLYVGGVTFEEMTAAVLADLVKSVAPAAGEVADELPPLPPGAPALEEAPNVMPATPPAEAVEQKPVEETIPVSEEPAK